MADDTLWNVFIPVNLLQNSPVYLIGYAEETTSSVYITDCRATHKNCEDDQVVGYFTVSNDSGVENSKKHFEVDAQIWLSMCKSSSALTECQLYKSGRNQQCRCVSVLFDPQEVLSSFLLAGDAEGQIGSLRNVYKQKCTAIQGRRAKLKHHCMRLLERTLDLCLCILITLFTVTDKMLSFISLKWCWSRICVQTPAIINNIAFKLNRFKRVQSDAGRSKLVLFDVCGQQLLDTMLGMAVMVYVMRSGCADTVAAAVMDWADDTAKNLNDLLHWLMGAPAGLKLNAQLTEYMGHFFLYHVYLWSGYLSVLRPLLGLVIWIAASFGTLGLSTLLCLVQDILSMLTLHIYCFYVYAARLYSLKTYALASLWRLFRGKKWNVLRLRVDSALYTIDQLCVGTLLFTVLLFLLPTSLLYYSVFLMLRLLVLSFHGLLTLVIDVINMVPAATVLLRLFKSKCVAGGLLFSVMQDAGSMETEISVALSMQTTQLPVQKLYCRAQAHMKAGCCRQEQQQYSWMELITRLISGNLIYPWVDPYNTGAKDKEKIV